MERSGLRDCLLTLSRLTLSEGLILDLVGCLEDVLRTIGSLG